MNQKIAIPITDDGKLSEHFGHCDQFSIFNVDLTNKVIVNIENKKAPTHSPGVLPN